MTFSKSTNTKADIELLKEIETLIQRHKNSDF